MNGIEVAPTLIWGDINNVTMKQVSLFRERVHSEGLQISGIQSLFFGHPEFQLFDKSTWPSMLLHLKKMLEIAGTLEAAVAVFGSPKNRVRGELEWHLSLKIAAEFLFQVEPILRENNVVLTLEPNAPEYGADFLLDYREVMELKNLMNSDYIGAQIDTGCLWMVKADPSEAIEIGIPKHIHLSTPNLDKVLGGG